LFYWGLSVPILLFCPPLEAFLRFTMWSYAAQPPPQRDVFSPLPTSGAGPTLHFVVRVFPSVRPFEGLIELCFSLPPFFAPFLVHDSKAFSLCVPGTVAKRYLAKTLEELAPPFSFGSFARPIFIRVSFFYPGSLVFFLRLAVSFFRVSQFLLPLVSPPRQLTSF